MNLDKNFKLPVSEAEQPKEILTEMDKQVLEHSLSRFKEYLGDLKPEELPSLILFLETSARPLYYALKPILDVVYKDKNKDLPEAKFLLTIRGLERDELEISPDADKEKVESLKKEINDLVGKTSSITWGLEETRSEKELKQERKLNQNRLFNKKLEIIKEAGWGKKQEEAFKKAIASTSEGNILVVDDFLHSFESIEQVERLKYLLPKDRKLNYFVMYNGRGSYRKSEEKNIEKKYKNKLHVGLDHDDEKTSSKMVEISNFRGFSYTGRGQAVFSYDYNPQVSESEKRAMVGVVKPNQPSQYVERIKDPDANKMTQLRKELTDIGTRIANQEKFDEAEWASRLKTDNSWF